MQKEQEYAASQSSLETMKEAYRKADAALLEERAKYQQVSAAMEDAQREIGELKTKASAHKNAAEVTLQELKEMRDHYAALKTEHEALAKELQETREKMAVSRAGCSPHFHGSPPRLMLRVAMFGFAVLWVYWVAAAALHLTGIGARKH